MCAHAAQESTTSCGIVLTCSLWPQRTIFATRAHDENLGNDKRFSGELPFDETLEEYHFYTTDEVLTEFLAFYSATDPTLRMRSAGFVRAILHNPRITVIPQTRMGFLNALMFYEARPDKHYSLTDCVSMQ